MAKHCVTVEILGGSVQTDRRFHLSIHENWLLQKLVQLLSIHLIEHLMEHIVVEYHLVVGLVVENGRLARFCETDKACLRILRGFEIIRVRIAALLVVHMLGERVHLVRAGLLERLRKDQHTVGLLVKDGQKVFLLLLCPLLRDKTLQLRPAVVVNGVEENQVRTNAPINH